MKLSLRIAQSVIVLSFCVIGIVPVSAGNKGYGTTGRIPPFPSMAMGQMMPPMLIQSMPYGGGPTDRMPPFPPMSMNQMMPLTPIQGQTQDMPHGSRPADGMPPFLPMPMPMDPMDSNLYQAFDTDGDGAVSPNEALTGVRGQHQKYDVDGDGALSVTEFKVLFAELTKEFAAQPFRMLDENDDGRIDEAELTFPVQMMIRVRKTHGEPAPGASVVAE